MGMIFLLLLTAGCNLPGASTPTPDLFATLQASTPLGFSSPDPSSPGTTTPEVPFATITPTSLSPLEVSSPSPSDNLQGHIVYTCQIFKVQASNQICIMNADGSGFRRLTTDNNRQHFYPSLSPDGTSVVYAAFEAVNNYEIYEMDLATGNVTQVTNGFGIETGPEISPDGTQITYAKYNAGTDRHQIVVADRNGSNAQNITDIESWDPTWSPNGNQILFASDSRGSVQLYVVGLEGKKEKIISNLPAIRGRSDWSADGKYIVTYSGPAWNRELYIMNADGTNAHQLTPSGGNSQGPSFSPDSQWVVFTAYFDHYGDDHGCEIYMVRIDGTDLRRLTDNNYCDYQPRWGL